MNASHIVEFWAVSVLFIITPGVDWAYAISAGLYERAVVPAVAGMLSGHLAATLLVAAGVGALIASVPMALMALTVAGAVYLVWLGVGMIARPSVPSASGNQAPRSWGRWAIKGFGVSGLNPKVFLLFLALLPQFTDPASHWSIPAQIVALGLVHVFSCGVVYILVGLGSQAVLRTRPGVSKGVSRVSGVAMIVIAAVLLSEQFARGLP